jgi:hypothetical protein
MGRKSLPEDFPVFEDFTSPEIGQFSVILLLIKLLKTTFLGGLGGNHDFKSKIMNETLPQVQNIPEPPMNRFVPENFRYCVRPGIFELFRQILAIHRLWNRLAE